MKIRKKNKTPQQLRFLLYSILFEFQDFLFLFRKVITWWEIQSSGSSSQVALVYLTAVHEERWGFGMPFPFSTQNPVNAYWNGWFFPSFYFFLFSLPLILPITVDVNRKNFWSLWEWKKKIDNIYGVAVHWKDI